MSAGYEKFSSGQFGLQWKHVWHESENITWRRASLMRTGKNIPTGADLTPMVSVT